MTDQTQNIKVIEEFANRESSKNILGWKSISLALADSVTALERENPLKGKWIKNKDVVICPSCDNENKVEKEVFFIYCQKCGRRVIK